jgi:hypothetical protein
MSEIENLKTTIATLQQQLEKLEAEQKAKKWEAEQKAKKWEPKAGKYRCSTDGVVHEAFNSDADISYGIERDTEEAAVERFKEMRRFSRLLAYRDEFAPGYKFNPIEHSFSVAYDRFDQEWVTVENEYIERVGVWFPRDAARELVKKLNSGEVEL